MVKPTAVADSTRQAPPGSPGGPASLVDRFTVYGARGDLGARGAVADLAAAAWTAPDESLSDTAVARWMRASIPPTSIALRADSLVAMREAAAAGLGLAALPCYLGDSDLRLARARPEPIAEMETALWVLTHEDLRRTARVHAVLEFLSDALGRERDLLEGRRPGA